MTPFDTAVTKIIHTQSHWQAQNTRIEPSDLEAAAWSKLTAPHYATLLQIWNAKGRGGVFKFLKTLIYRCFVDLGRIEDRTPTVTTLDAALPAADDGDPEDIITAADLLTEADLGIEQFPYADARKVLTDLQYDGLVQQYTLRDLAERYNTSKDTVRRRLAQGIKTLKRHGIQPKQAKPVTKAKHLVGGRCVLAQTSLHPEYIRPEVLDEWRLVVPVRPLVACPHVGDTMDEESHTWTVQQFSGEELPAVYQLCDTCWHDRYLPQFVVMTAAQRLWADLIRVAVSQAIDRIGYAELAGRKSKKVATRVA
jgi:hypothetical protein